MFRKRADLAVQLRVQALAMALQFAESVPGKMAADGIADAAGKFEQFLKGNAPLKPPKK